MDWLERGYSARRSYRGRRNYRSKQRRRFDDELIELMLKFKWWDKSIAEIDELIPVLTCSDLEKVKAEIKRLIEK